MLAALSLALLLALSLPPLTALRARRLQPALRTPMLLAAGAADLHADYARRLAAAGARGRAAPAARFVRWLHIPKTGTSFANTLVRWGCGRIAPDTFVVPRKERPARLELPLARTVSWDWLFHNASGRAWLRGHCPTRLVTHRLPALQPRYALYMHRALDRWEVPSAVALFRLPLQRTYSNYLHLNLHYNESRSPRESLAQFLRRTQFWSQQAKLLLGRHYRDERVVTHREALKAALIVRNRLLFVGLTEEFELSARLFHARFGGVPHRAQFENVRPGLSRYRTAEGRSSSFRYDESLFDGWTDPADHVVYKAAKARFWREVQDFQREIELDGLGKVQIRPDWADS